MLENLTELRTKQHILSLVPTCAQSMLVAAALLALLVGFVIREALPHLAQVILAACSAVREPHNARLLFSLMEINNTCVHLVHHGLCLLCPATSPGSVRLLARPCTRVTCYPRQSTTPAYMDVCAVWRLDASCAHAHTGPYKRQRAACRLLLFPPKHAHAHTHTHIRLCTKLTCALANSQHSIGVSGARSPGSGRLCARTRWQATRLCTTFAATRRSPCL